MQVEAVGAKRHAGQHAATGLQGVLQLGISPCSAGGVGFKEESASRLQRRARCGRAGQLAQELAVTAVAGGGPALGGLVCLWGG